MKLIDTILFVEQQLNKISGVTINKEMSECPISLNNIEKIEKEINYTFPNYLKEFYQIFSKGIRLSWYVNKGMFGSMCDNGELQINSLNSIKDEYKGMIQYAKDFPIIADWFYWIPIISFPNGDAFCIDKRTDKIVFLEHEAIEGEPVLHGLLIAPNINELFYRWAKILFVDVYYWEKVTNEKGLDIDNVILKTIRSQTNFMV